MTLYINDIKKILPHRSPFLLVDRIDEIEPNKMAKGIKAVSYNEPFFVGHYPKRPIMPGVLIIEALAQVGAIALLYNLNENSKTPLFAGINKARFKRQVIPGDTLVLEVNLIKKLGDVGIGHGIAKVNNEICCDCELLFYLD